MSIKDLFISYSWRDYVLAERISKALRDNNGLSLFFDRWYLVPGQPWPLALQQALSECSAVAVLVGPGGMGPWQQREINFALDRQVHTPGFPVIPVLLPGADPVLSFLALNTWIDLRQSPDDPVLLSMLAAAARGTPPSPDLQEQISSTLTNICPYRGLLYFREEDSSFFFGRDVAIQQLIELVNRRSLVAVVGASGCGKSSIVRAGLIPILRCSRDNIWEIVTMVPADRPLHSLAIELIPFIEPEMSVTDRLIEANKLEKALYDGALSLNDVVSSLINKQPGTDRLLLVVDQWEDIYTLTQDLKARRRFVEEILTASDIENGKLSVVFTLRGDFVANAFEFRQLCDRLQGAQINLGPMTRSELEIAITSPAMKVGIEIEPGLINRLLDDVGEEPGNLPLLEFVLRRLWEHRQGRRLHHNAYEEMGGLQGAIAKRAEEFFQKLTEFEQEIVHQIFLLIVRPGDQGDDTRRRIRFAEIDDESHKLIRKLADERLLTTSSTGLGEDETIEVAHEALIRHWDRLRTWLNEDREFILWRERTRVKQLEWKRVQDNSALLRGSILDEAIHWTREHYRNMSNEEREYINKSREYSEQQTKERLKSQHTVNMQRIVIAILIIPLLIVAYLFYDQRIQIQDSIKSNTRDIYKIR